MAKVIGLPKLSPTMDEGVLVHWAKREGEAVEVDDLLAEVETDKATMEFRSFDRGVLLKILAAEGASLRPDAPVAILGAPGEDISGLVAALGGGAGARPGPPGALAGARPEGRGVLAAGEIAEAPAGKDGARATSAARVRASPFVRRLARERGLSLAGLVGSGPGGRVVARDLAHLAGSGAAAPGPRREGPAAFSRPSSAGPARVVPLSPMRKTIARRLSEAKREVPHYYLRRDVDATALVDARAMLNAGLAAAGERVSINDLVLRAAALALRRVPAVNASFRGDAIEYHDRVDVSVAVALEDGLITPVVRAADQKGVVELGREVARLAARAREKRLQPDEYTGGTFSVSNLGMHGVDDFAAVINPPEAAILAVGRLREAPVVRGGAVVAGRLLGLTLSCDHRVIDGAVGGAFLEALRELLERPVLLV